MELTPDQRFELLNKQRELLERKKSILQAQIQTPPATTSASPENPVVKLTDEQKAQAIQEHPVLGKLFTSDVFRGSIEDIAGAAKWLNENILGIDEAALAKSQEGGTNVGGFLKEAVAPVMQTGAGIAAGVGAEALAAKGLSKAAPALAKAAEGSVLGQGIIGGAKKLGAKAATGAVSGAAGMAGFEAGQGKVPTAEDIATGAAIGAGLGAVPAAIGAIGATGKEFLGKALPESLVKSAIKLKPTQKIRVAEELAKTGDEAIAETADEYILKNRINGSPEEVASQLAQKAKDARQAKLSVLQPLSQKINNPRVSQLADATVDALDGVVGREVELARAKSLQTAVNSKQGATLSQIDELKTLSDDVLDIYTQSGNVKEGNIKKGLATIREEVKTLIEKEAAKLGVSNIKQLNQDVIINRALSRAVAGQAVGAGGNALAKLSDLIVGGSIVGGGVAGGGVSWDNVKNSALLALGVVAGTKLFNPTARIKLANKLSSMFDEGEAGKFLQFLLGESKSLEAPIKDKAEKALFDAGLRKQPPSVSIGERRMPKFSVGEESGLARVKKEPPSSFNSVGTTVSATINTQLLKTFKETIKKEGGITIKPFTGVRATTGTAVAGFVPPKVVQNPKLSDLRNFVAEHKKFFANPKAYLGGWVNEKGTWFDVSITLPREQAIKIGKKLNQEGVYDIDVGGESGYIPTGGDGNVLHSIEDGYNLFTDLTK